MRLFKNKPLLIALILLIVFFAVLIMTANTDEAKGPVSVVGKIIAPIQRFFYGATDSATDIVNNPSKADLILENQDLKDEVARLEGELKDYNTIYQENKRYKELLGFTQTLENVTYITTSITEKSTGDWFDEFTIAAGKDQGIQNGMVVYTTGGLVGRVVYTGANSAKVMAIIHDDSGVPALMERTRENGVVKPAKNAKGDILQVFYLPAEADVQPGDKVITSGIGGVFPKGIVIGTVTEVSEGTTSEKVVYMKSAVDFKHMEEVVVIIDEGQGAAE